MFAGGTARPRFLPLPLPDGAGRGSNHLQTIILNTRRVCREENEMKEGVERQQGETAGCGSLPGVGRGSERLAPAPLRNPPRERKGTEPLNEPLPRREGESDDSRRKRNASRGGCLFRCCPGTGQGPRDAILRGADPGDGFSGATKRRSWGAGDGGCGTGPGAGDTGKWRESGKPHAVPRAPRFERGNGRRGVGRPSRPPRRRSQGTRGTRSGAPVRQRRKAFRPRGGPQRSSCSTSGSGSRPVRTSPRRLACQTLPDVTSRQVSQPSP